MKKTWKKLPFLDVFEDVSGGNIKTPQGEYLKEGLIPVVDQGKTLIGGFTNDFERVCKTKSPVIIFGDHTRIIKYVDFPFAMGADGVKVLKPKDDANAKYLFYYLSALQIPNAGYDRHFKYLKRTEIILPDSEDEQKRIAAVLDKASALREKRRAAITKLDQLLQSVFLDMFGDPVSNPKGWETPKFGNVFKTIRYGTGSPPPYVSEGIPFIRATNIKNGTIVLKDLKHITESDSRKIEKCRIFHGDLLVVRSGVNSGDCALVPKEFDGAFAAYDLIVEIDYEFAVFYNFLINSKFGKQIIEKLTRRAAQPHLNADQLSNIKFIKPTSNELKKFVAIHSEIENLKKRAAEASNTQFQLFQSLQQRAFAGELFGAKELETIARVI